ncbi:hypothetical protein Q7C36_020892 [Tachysurus vachellii]|uniref:Jacalin-type lectin domain-containing protein n=1 Tax=Tachysurus vachellii TaxID=175792 RepID=A0AA88IWN1_TACVA|nr:hypothetical protein Q7C36_020892 [Tachysurus vachellii]
MSYLAPIYTIGGQGGSEFDFDGIANGATLKQIWVWLTDGRSMQFGEPGGRLSQFEFEDGEHFSSLSLWGNGAGTRLGAIKIKTNKSREFFPKMSDWGLKTEYPIDVGSGICMGIGGRAGADIDCLCFKFINTIKSTKLTNVHYPTLHSLLPNVAVEEIKSMTISIETSKKITKTSSWSVTNKLEASFHLEVQAGVPGLVEISSGFSLTVGTESSYGLENTVEKTELFSFPVKVPPGKTIDVDITIGRAAFDLPYTGTVQVTCYNGSVLEFKTSGTYKGVTYTDAKITVIESGKNM